jgi:RES domain-containing protein
MIVYRICKAKYKKTAFSGEGGLKSAGRWHHKGQPIIYAAATLSLAAIELFVHLGRADSKIALVNIAAEIPDGVQMDAIDPESLPKNWNAFPSINATMDLGTAWCASLRSAVLRVPSAIVPGEFNYLLNPQHPDFTKIKIVASDPFSFDSKMWKK